MLLSSRLVYHLMHPGWEPNPGLPTFQLSDFLLYILIYIPIYTFINYREIGWKVGKDGISSRKNTFQPAQKVGIGWHEKLFQTGWKVGKVGITHLHSIEQHSPYHSSAASYILLDDLEIVPPIP